ncbi:L-xylulose reductase-like isoform X1 [Cylas formicarius]|uniref:L-xylulose reductase-like isoform X1 n=2 Tax=Cylas formicarius TaxID=197179 RepID=UPI002958A320|nr:L-xylulose reductase-like isoform X1 [Cylas formicarius]
MEITFPNTRALVTGASKGIGKDIAIKLAQCGAQVMAIGRSQADLDSLKNIHPSIETITLDLRNWQSTEDTLKNIESVDLLVNNAGEGMIKPVLDVEEKDIDRIFDLNVKGLMHVTKLVLKDMLRRKSSGAIVNVSSQAGLAGLYAQSVYCASKGAVDAYTRALALEMGPQNIRVNSVNPTVVMTEMGKKWWSDQNRAADMLSKIPLGRFANVNEVVDVVIFLLSDKASMVNGVCVPIDGGYTCT